VNPGDISTPLAALVAGMVTSLHCIGMCGPLACVRQGGAAESAVGKWRFVAGYHSGRLISYAALGALAGVFSERLAGWTDSRLTHLLPWAFIVLFCLMILGWEKFVHLPNAMMGWLGRGFGWSRKHGGGSGLVIGLGTPLLPCGPLYVMLASMMFAGSAAKGALLMAAFALGTTGLLLFLQMNMGWLSGRLNPKQLFWLRRGLACSALVVMVWRAAQDVPLFQGEVPCPMCP